MSIKQMTFYSLVISLMTISVQAQMTSMQSGTSGSSTIPATIPPPMTQQQPGTTTPPAQQPAKRAPVQPIQQVATYFHPGILALQDGKWVGTDQLLNLSRFIGVYVEEVKAPKVALPLSPDDIKKRVEAIFSQGGIYPINMVPPTAPPLPAFHIRLFVYPLGRGYVVFCEARLLESVQLARFSFDPNTAFQAITWQRESLILAPAATAVDQLEKLVDEMALSFVSVYRNYEQKKRELIK